VKWGQSALNTSNSDSRYAIEVLGVTKMFGSGNDTVRAVDDVSIDIRQNEFLTLLGPSGCGKTTLLRMIAGFEHPTEGQILLDGEDKNDLYQNYKTLPFPEALSV